MTREQLFAENMLRKNKWKKLLEYNPATGYGATGKRRRIFFLKQGFALYFPNEMFFDKDVKSILRNISKNEQDLSDEVIYILNIIREKYDFEYYAWAKLRIQDKSTGKIIPFVLNYAQRLLHRDVEDERKNGIPVRKIIIKSRQWGGSTYIQARFFWLQDKLLFGANSIIVAMVERQARNIRGMYNRMCRYHPDRIKLRNYEGGSLTKTILERECTITVGSIERPDNLRCENITLAHLSEVGLWKKTLEKNPEDLIQTVRGSVLSESDTEIYLESTAKGIGNFFHNEYLEARDKKNGYKPFFMGWQNIYHLYKREFKTGEEAYNFYKGFTPYELWLWEIKGCTLEQIFWYHNKLKEFKGDIWRMQSEFPTEIEEAFSATGNRYFPKKYIVEAEKNIKIPVSIGDIVSPHKKGAECLKNFSFIENPSLENSFKIWKMPDKNMPVKNRYITVMDVGGRWVGADNTVILVVDRYWTLYNGSLEVVATWVGHIDYDIGAWKAAQIAKWYNNSLLVVESNTIDKNKNLLYNEGDQSLTVLNEISKHYSNLYTRTRPEKISDGEPIQWGFHTNVATRKLILNSLLFALRDGEFTEREREAITEYDQFQINDKGKPEAVDGAHDDRVIARAIATYIHAEYDPPAVITEKRKTTTNVASDYL